MQTTNGDQMKLLSILCFALFPFLHNTVYQAKLTSCDANSIVLNSQGNDMLVSLFNLNITSEKGWNRTCTMLKEAKEITFEIDVTSKISEPVPVYLFVDGKLIQEEIIRSEEGYSIIHNPEYKYEKRLEKIQQSSKTMADQSNQPDTPHQQSYGFIYLLVFILLWVILYYQLIYKKRKVAKKTTSK